MAKDGADAAIRKMVDEKVIRFRGFSCHNPELTQDGLARTEPQAIPVIAKRYTQLGFRVAGPAPDEGKRHRGRRDKGGR
jgi:hypothetical protein